MQVAEVHYDWILRIMQAAMDITVHNESRPSASQQITPVAAFLNETFSLCLSIREIATALPNFKVLEWKPPQRNDGPLSDVDAANLAKAICQGVCKMHPESPLVIGIQLQLEASGVIDQDAARPNNMDLQQEDQSTSDRDLAEHQREIDLEDQHDDEVCYLPQAMRCP